MDVAPAGRMTPAALIELAFSAYNIPAAHAMIRGQGVERTNIPRARPLAYYLLTKFAGLTIAAVAEIFDENKFTCRSGCEYAQIAIESKALTWRNHAMKKKYRECLNEIRRFITK